MYVRVYECVYMLFAVKHVKPTSLYQNNKICAFNQTILRVIDNNMIYEGTV